jgi:DNA-binding PadR family transcriptional regulator
MLSGDLARLYSVAPKVLIQAVKRNRNRFPSDFLFQLSPEEFQNLKSQFVTSSWGGVRRALPYAFTEQGVAMLSSVLSSPRAIQANITIMRAFVRIRELASTNRELLRKLAELEKRVDRHDSDINRLIDAIRTEAIDVEEKRRRIGFL